MMKMIIDSSVISVLQPIFQNFSRKVCVDSRNLNKGDVFFALPGARSDGHYFLREAESRGASYLVVKKGYLGENFTCPLVPVDDPLTALQELAQKYIRYASMTTCAITGSFGKTTTKDFLTQLTRPFRKVLATVGSQNSQIGLPLSIINTMQGDEKIGIIEMGLTEKGHIQRLVEIVPPDIAAICALAPVHIAQFENLEALAKAKKEIFLSPRIKYTLVAKECMQLDLLLDHESPQKEVFSLHQHDANWRLEVRESALYVHHNDEVIQLPKPLLPASYFYHNLLCAIVLARALCLTWEEIAEGILHIALPDRRFQEIVKQGITFIDDAYNANETSMISALNALKTKAVQAKKIAVIGELTELGIFSEEIHRRVGAFALECVDDIVCFGKACFPIVAVCNQKGKMVKHFEDMAELMCYLQNTVQSGDLVLLKGSRSNRLERILEAF